MPDGRRREHQRGFIGAESVMTGGYARQVRCQCHCGEHWPLSKVLLWLRHIYRCTKTVLEYPGKGRSS